MIRSHYPLQTAENQEGLDLTALIDVIFTLIIFLILTMGTTQVMTEINITHTQKAKFQEPTEEQVILVEVNHRNGTWKSGGQTSTRFTDFRKDFLERHRDSRKRPVILALEKTLPVEHLVELMDFLSLNGFTDIQIVSEWQP